MSPFLTSNDYGNIREENMKLLKRLWRDERGVVNTTDIILGTTLLIIGSIVGLVILLGIATALLNKLIQSAKKPAGE